MNLVNEGHAGGATAKVVGLGFGAEQSAPPRLDRPSQVPLGMRGAQRGNRREGVEYVAHRAKADNQHTKMVAKPLQGFILSYDGRIRSTGKLPNHGSDRFLLILKNDAERAGSDGRNPLQSTSQIAGQFDFVLFGCQQSIGAAFFRGSGQTLDVRRRVGVMIWKCQGACQGAVTGFHLLLTPAKKSSGRAMAQNANERPVTTGTSSCRVDEPDRLRQALSPKMRGYVALLVANDKQAGAAQG